MIALRGVGKTYAPLLGAPVRAVTDVSLEIVAGEVMGIAGPNGAGKSTLIAMLLGLLAPTDGAITIDGSSPRAFVEREGVAYLPELMTFPLGWTVQQTLERLAILAGIPAAQRARAVTAAIAELEIGEHAAKKLKELSKGNLQRVGLAQTLLSPDARVMIFDEPTHGLDPVWTQRFRDLVVRLRGSGRAILIASHDLDELERLCDRVAIIDRGRIQRVVTFATHEGAVVERWRIRVVEGVEAFRARCPEAEPGTGGGEWIIAAPDARALSQLLAGALAAGVIISEVAPAQSVLASAFHASVRR
ncbi:MAG: ABC transporter ATP-binding protein [Gemmatimonadaceae bacterium]|nr:ABC transporter ATP-binding protein [Gemmatimonadaceae bacterium]